MVPDSAITAAERTETAGRLITEAQDANFVELVTVYALELCVLGGPKHPLFEQIVADAWMQLGNRRRRKLMEYVTAGMVRRGLLIESSANPGSGHADETYSLKPELGIALAARCRPAFIVLTETADSSHRTPRFFALGDQDQPVRGVVIEEPAALPPEIAGNFPHVKKLGPLGRFYRYMLVSRDRAASALAEWAIAPPPQVPGADEGSRRVVTLYRRYDGGGRAGFRLSVRGDGATARVDARGLVDGRDAAAGYDREELCSVMRDLLAVAPR